MSRFTILGSSGFIGGHLVSRLRSDGHQVFCPQRHELGSLGGRDIGHVFYCLGVDDARKNPYGAFEAHVANLVTILQACRFASITYLSSTRVYLGSESAREDAELRILPDDGNAIYNVTKIAGEQMCLTADKLSIRVVRLSNVIGFAPNGISLIPMLIKNALDKKTMSLTISPESAKDYIALDDVLYLLPRIAIEGLQRCYNIASGIDVTLDQIIKTIQREIPCDAKWRKSAPTIIFPTIDISRIKSEFLFSPRNPIGFLSSTCNQFREWRRRTRPL